MSCRSFALVVAACASVLASCSPPSGVASNASGPNPGSGGSGGVPNAGGAGWPSTFDGGNSDAAGSDGGPSSTCGDGILDGKEQCDDANTQDGDGCSSTCQVEKGWACVTTNGKSVCHQTVCGDGKQEGLEQCDDGNLIPFDGCSPWCTIEPSCSDGQCRSVCGDGIKFPGEACDDGNTLNGDGCSSTCQVEPGWTCNTVVQPPPDQLVIPILYRDFLYYGTTSPGPGHPDFERYSGAATGLVKSVLGSDGKPVFNSSTGSGTTVVITDATSFCWWYHDAGCDPASPGGANPYDKVVYTTDGQPNGPPTTLTLTKLAAGTYQFSSDAFFPIDGLGWGNGQTTNGHNFSFTSELHYLFTYQGGASAPVLDFSGDDDVYVFINGKLAVDLGGVHGAMGDSVTLDAATASNFGLTPGGVYDIAVFQAERHTQGSSYTLTLSNFVSAVSHCQKL